MILHQTLAQVGDNFIFYLETSFHMLSYFFFSLHFSQLLHICLGTVTEALGLTPLTEQASAPHHHFQGQVDQFLPSMTILEHLQEELFLRLIAEVMCCLVILDSEQHLFEIYVVDSLQAVPVLKARATNLLRIC